jgi:hypothetical protein
VADNIKVTKAIIIISQAILLLQTALVQSQAPAHTPAKEGHSYKSPHKAKLHAHNQHK